VRQSVSTVGPNSRLLLTAAWQLMQLCTGLTKLRPAVLHTGSGKTRTLEGSRGRETWGTTDGDGLVHLAIDELFGLVHGKAITIGEAPCTLAQHPGSSCLQTRDSSW
jgi:hypothetical protein